MAKIKKAQNGFNGAFAQSLEVKKSTLDSVRKKQKAAMDSSRASFSRGVQNAKSKISNEKAAMKKYQAGGVVSKKVKAPMVDPKGAFTKVQKRTIAGKKASAKKK